MKGTCLHMTFLPNPEKAHDPGIQLKEGDSSEPHIHQSAIISIVVWTCPSLRQVLVPDANGSFLIHPLMPRQCLEWRMGCFRLLLLPPVAPNLIATSKKAICSYVDTFDANFATHKQLQTLQQLQDFLNFDSWPSIEFTLSVHSYESSK